MPSTLAFNLVRRMFPTMFSSYMIATKERIVVRFRVDQVLNIA